MDTQRIPKVTVVTPVYNRLSYLAATLDSVLAQTHQDWEMIVVDDGSQEDVAGFMAQYTDARICFLRQANQGNAAARNAGIAQGSGEFVICLDSDDVWQPAMLATCAAFLAGHPDVDVVYTQFQRIDGHGQPMPGPTEPTPNIGNLLEPLLMGYPILPSSAMARRSCFQRWGAYTPGLDDWELWLRWAAKGCRFACIEQSLLQYRIHDQNFNLAYDRRRAAHFAMLDKFYNEERLPERALRLRQQAYANQHYHFAVLAWELSRPADGVAEFGAAVLGRPAYLADIDFYTRVACAHQGRIDAGSARGLSLTTAEATLTQCLGALFDRPDLPPEVQTRRREAYGWAYLALARLAYGVAHDMTQARRWLRQSVQAWPAVLWQSDWAAWVARSTVGHERIQKVKREMKVEHAES